MASKPSDQGSDTKDAEKLDAAQKADDKPTDVGVDDKPADDKPESKSDDKPADKPESKSDSKKAAPADGGRPVGLHRE